MMIERAQMSQQFKNYGKDIILMQNSNCEFIQHDGSIKTLSQDQHDKLKTLSDLIINWNGLNLIAKSTQADIFGWHINEALSILTILETKNLNTKSNEHFVDFGAGSGVIGLSLAIAGISNIHLIERSDAKLNFLLNIAKFRNSYSQIPNFKHFSLIVRGVDKIENLLTFFAKYIHSNQLRSMILFKSSFAQQELRYANLKWNFECTIHNRVANADGKILIIENISSKQNSRSN